MHIVFAGTPEFAKTILKRLIKTEDIIVDLVLSQPDKKAGRGRKLMPSPVKELALACDITVEQPISLKDKSCSTANRLASLNPDLMIVAAYGLILPQYILDIPKYGCINAHASLLPKWRGASPIQHAIMHGDKETGICAMQMEAGLDSGPVLLKKSLPIEDTDTSASLHDKLSILAADVIVDTIKQIQAGKITPVIQEHDKATYAPKIQKEDAKIDWEEDGIAIERKVRAYNPWPISHTKIADLVVRIYKAYFTEKQHNHKLGEVISIDKHGLQIAVKNGILTVEKIQLPGKKAVNIKDLVNALPKGFTIGAQCE